MGDKSASPLPVNAARGEVAVEINGVPIVVAVTMEGLARLSAELGCTSLRDLQHRLIGAELLAMFAVLRHFVVNGDGVAAAKAMKLDGALALGGAMATALLHHFSEQDRDTPQGNGKGAKGTS